eukprot:423062_1
MFFRTLFYICIYIWLDCYNYSAASSNTVSITNSTGQYVTYKMKQKKYITYADNIICKHGLLCHIQLNCDYTAQLEIQADADNVYMDLRRCRSVKVYSEANYLTIRLNSSNRAELHFEKNNNVDIYLIYVDYSSIYAQYAKNVNVLLSDSNYENIFYLNNVSNQVNFEFNSSRNRKNTIIATNASYFNLSIKDDSTFNGNVFCPYRSNNSCNINIPTVKQINGLNIYVSNMKLNNIYPLNIWFTNNASFSYYDYTVYCQENKDSLVYESFTKMLKDGTECKNVTSECCYLKHLRENIFCPHDDNCIVNCNQTDCVNKNIYSSSLTNTLHVICTNRKCYNTIIYCPLHPNSVCNVSCDADEYACYGTIIKYNTNNNNVNNFNCSHQGSCTEMQIFVDDINNTKNILNYMNITCMDCSYSTFIINTELKRLYIDCIDERSCLYMQIHGVLVQNMQINCHHLRSCSSMTIYPKVDSVDTISIHGISIHSMRIISTIPQHTLDYLSVTDNSEYCTGSSSISEYSGENSYFKPLFINNTSTNLCTCNLKSKYMFSFRGEEYSHVFYPSDGMTIYPNDPDLFSCPFSNAYNNIINCEHGK